MCLLVKQSSTAPNLSNEWLENFYSFNSDGVGVMYSENGILIIEKALPKSSREFVNFYRSHIQGRDCAFHLRMKTHGDIDLENCHPYEVLNRKDHGENVWLMHNGILATGNDADKSKSDTWHYIRNFLRPMLADNPKFLFHPSFAEIVGEHIGASNKFILMSDSGKTVTINEDCGVYWAGLWLSNEYAWSASKSASDKPEDDYSVILQQASEVPQIKTFYSGKYDYYSGGDNYYQSYNFQSVKEYDDYVDQFDDYLDMYRNEFLDIGYVRASKLTNRRIYAFCDKYGDAAFYDLADCLLDHSILEDNFVKAIEDHSVADKYFPFLETYLEKI